jgi:hypothetical protein
MRRRTDLSSRVDEVTHTSAPMTWDPKIAQAVLLRRQRHMAVKAPEDAASGTETIQARLAEARARQEADAASPD